MKPEPAQTSRTPEVGHVGAGVGHAVPTARTVPGRRPRYSWTDGRWLTVHALTYVVVNLLLVTAWIFTEGTFFWPVIPLFTWAVALVVHTWAVLVARART